MSGRRSFVGLAALLLLALLGRTRGVTVYDDQRTGAHVEGNEEMVNNIKDLLAQNKKGSFNIFKNAPAKSNKRSGSGGGGSLSMFPCPNKKKSFFDHVSRLHLQGANLFGETNVEDQLIKESNCKKGYDFFHESNFVKKGINNAKRVNVHVGYNMSSKENWEIFFNAGPPEGNGHPSCFSEKG